MKRLCALLLAGALVLALPALASARTGGAAHKWRIPTIQKPGDPGSTEYQEDVPSAFGNVPVNTVGGGPGSAGTLPAAVSSALAQAGAAGRAAAALAAAGVPQAPGGSAGASAQSTATHARGARHRAGQGRSGTRRGTGRGRPGARHGAGQVRPGARRSGAGGSGAAGTGAGASGSAATGSAAGAAGTASGSLAHAGSGRSVADALVGAISGSDGGIGGVLPALLLASAAVAVGVLLARRRAQR